MFGILFGNKKPADKPVPAARNAKPAAKPPVRAAFKPPVGLAEIKSEQVLSSSKGKYPAHNALKSSYVLVEVSGWLVEYVSDAFVKDSPHYFELRGNLLADKARIHPEKIKVGYADIQQLYDKAEPGGKRAANEHSGRATPPSEALTVFKEIIRAGMEMRASDVHFVVRKEGSVTLARVFGKMQKTPHFRHDSNYLHGVISSVYNKNHDPQSNSHEAFSTKLRTSCTVTFADMHCKLRWQTIPLGYDDGYDVIVRIIPTGIESVARPLHILGYLPTQERLLNLVANTPRGGIFLAGETGSGKSTTLQTMMQIVRGQGGKKIYTVEDPIEYKIFGATQIMVQRNESSEVNAFAEVMKAALRGDPDVLMPGEIRDRETAGLCQEIIQTGHQLLTTVHVNSGIGIPSRLCSANIGMSRDTVTEPDFLSALVYQHLAPVMCEGCRVPLLESGIDLSASEMYAHLADEHRYGIPLESVYVTGEGCSCEGCRNGISGMTVCAEVIIPGQSQAMLDAFRESRVADALRIYKSSRGYNNPFTSPDCTGKTALEAALYKVHAGMLDPREVESLFGSFALQEIVN